MNPYMAARLAQDREEELRRRAELYRLLAQVSGTEPRWRGFLSAAARRSAPLLHSLFRSRRKSATVRQALVGPCDGAALARRSP